jgi:hypothetical protein
VQSTVWDHPYGFAPSPETGSSQVYLPPSGRPTLPSVPATLGFLAGGLGLLLSLFMLFGWVVPLTQEVIRLQNTVIALADDVFADSNGAVCPDPRLRILSPLTGSTIPVGEELELAGTAMFDEAARYQLHARPAGSQTWNEIGAKRGDERLGELATWDTKSVPPGNYEVRLTAVDRNNVRLNNSPLCVIAIQLTP